METVEDEIKAILSKNQPPKFYCETCDYYTSKKSNYDTHLLTPKHSRMTKRTFGGQKQADFKPTADEGFICICGKEFKYRQGLWKHKKTCEFKSEHIEQLNKDDLIIQLLKQNAELLEILKTGTTNNSHNVTTNSHNKSFNLNFFLNETCKNAMNITDFVDSIKLQLSDLERVGELGYVQGISDIITTNLKAMDVTLRPIHCTDKKRETMYIRDNNEWKKEEDSKPHLRNAIKKIEDKNRRLLPQYRIKYPDYNDSSSKRVDKYDKIILESLGGIEEEKIDKVIRNISNVTTIDK